MASEYVCFSYGERYGTGTKKHNASVFLRELYGKKFFEELAFTKSITKPDDDGLFGDTTMNDVTSKLNTIDVTEDTVGDGVGSCSPPYKLLEPTTGANTELLLSYSSVRAYLVCPYRYFLDKVVKLPSGKSNNSFLSYGSFLHSAIEKYSNLEISKKMAVEQTTRNTSRPTTISDHLDDVWDHSAFASRVRT